MAGLSKGIPEDVFKRLEDKLIEQRKTNPIAIIARMSSMSDTSGTAASSSLADVSVSPMGVLYQDSAVDAAFAVVVGGLNAVKDAYEALEAKHNTLLSAHKALVGHHQSLSDKFDNLRDACAEMGIVG